MVVNRGFQASQDRTRNYRESDNLYRYSGYNSHNENIMMHETPNLRGLTSLPQKWFFSKFEWALEAVILFRLLPDFPATFPVTIRLFQQPPRGRLCIHPKIINMVICSAFNLPIVGTTCSHNTERKGKINHLTGTGPKEGDPNFTAWDEEDSLIIAWLWNSMDIEISDTIMFLNTAKEIWDAIEQTYSKAKDAAQVYDVKGNKSVTEYANQLKSLWMELDHYRIIKTKCAKDAAIVKELIEQDKVYDFPVGLNPEFDQVKIQNLGKSEVPSFNEVVAIIRSEESRRNLMVDSLVVESLAMVAENAKNRHTREKCWKLHGIPPSHEL
ncbi:hypothetical protein CR513_40209, partial [Mucuna pruriens]